MNIEIQLTSFNIKSGDMMKKEQNYSFEEVLFIKIYVSQVDGGGGYMDDFLLTQFHSLIIEYHSK